jgi:3-deoxy-manno-octulosonate cytidylyltransferase (CMP-KDO synthetase)
LPEQLFDPNVVKVVMDHAGYALYFSRAPIPWQRDRFDMKTTASVESLPGMHRHLGLYAYRAGFLSNYAGLKPAPIEKMESLEQLRVLWHGGRIAVGIASEPPPAGVDTAADLERVTRALA